MNFPEEFLSLFNDEENDDKVKSIIANCRLHHIVDANARYPGATLLHHAVKRNNIEITKYLLENGCDVDARNAYDNTPLMLAAMYHRVEILQLLLSAGANVSIEEDDDKEDTVDLMISENSSIVQVLLAALGQKYTRSEIARRMLASDFPLKAAVLTRDAKIVEYLIERGIPVESENPEYETPLHIAVGLSDVETVKVLLKWGATVHASNYEGATPLHYLNYDDLEHDDERLQILKILLSRKIELTSITVDGSFPVEPTLVRGCAEAVRLVLQSWTDFNRENRQGATILHCLAMNTNRGVVDELKNYIEMLDVDATDRFGHRPLSRAVSRGNADMVQFLMDRGAEAVPEALFEVFRGESNSDLEASRDRCVEILLQGGVDPEAIFVSGDCRKIVEGVETRGLGRIKLAVAQLAICEKQGIGISESVGSVIYSHRKLGTHLEKCRRLLEKKLYGSVSIFELLAADERKMSKYLNNNELALKLVRMGYKRKLKSVYWYYYSTMKKKFIRGMIIKMLRDNAAKIIGKISGNRLGVREVPTEMVIDYLNVEDLWQLKKY